MTDATSDKVNRKHGVLWYVGWLLFVYLASYIPVAVFVVWLDSHEWIFTAVGYFYFPVEWILVAAGLLNPVSDLITWFVQRLPLRP